ncbi:sensor domain-containing diguanylate cyclase [Lactococcus lactis]|uniref:sensor domain-containing diguanylate cyclase n=1 Tax=Lactococcus lactis TaxID=1358 RepID=UPI0022DE4BC4|nr:sensor domain-containing diguanylate cyclase [Lactococcus lactis]WBM78765.1 sensor domain-containing diguanylate cyclase [Lactococcus lactis]
MEYIIKSKELSEKFDHLFFDIVNSSPLSIIIADKDRRIVYVNHYFCLLTGYEYEEVIGKNLSFLKSGLTPEGVYRGMYTALEKIGSWRGEVRNRKENGDEYHELASISMIYDKEKNPYFIAFKQDITEMVRLNRDVFFDSTTNLYNRRFLDKQLPDDIQSALKNRKPLSIIFMDLDFFKNINDEYGHVVGDKLIKLIASFLLENLHKRSSWIARYGGDEFLICLPKTDRVKAFEIGNHLRETLEHYPFHIQDKVISVTCSFGVEEISNKNPVASVDDLLNIVDKKLYLSKTKGKNAGHL